MTSRLAVAAKLNLDMNKLPSQDQNVHELDLEVLEKLPLGTRTIELLNTVAREFAHHLSENNLSFTWESIDAYLDDLASNSQPSLKPATLNSKRYALKKLLLSQPSMAHPSSQAAIEQAFKTIKRNQVDLRVHETEYLEAKEVQQIVDLCLSGKDRQVRVGIIVAALFETGCRVSELINIRLEDCQIGEQLSIRILGKGKKERLVFMRSKTFNRARTFFGGKTYLFESEKGTPIFRNNIFRSIQRMSRRAGINKTVHPHTLRHSCAMHLIKVRDLNPKAVSEYLGHSDVAITLKAYIHDMPSYDEVLGL